MFSDTVSMLSHLTAASRGEIKGKQSFKKEKKINFMKVPTAKVVKTPIRVLLIRDMI